LTIPKAKNPELQEAFECAYRWGEKCNNRLLLSIRKNKVAQEKEQRRYETDKIQAKAAKYPPYQGLDARLNSQENDLDKQLKTADDEYLCELEQLVSRFTSATKTAPTITSTSVNTTINPHDPVIVAMEANFERISQLTSKQTQQIQSLLEENNEFRKTTGLLKTGFDSVKSNYEALKADYDALQSNHDALQSKLNTLYLDLQASQSKQAEAQNTSLKNQTQKIESDMGKRLHASEERLTELINKSSNAAAPLAEFSQAKLDIENLAEIVNTDWTKRITAAEAKLKGIKDKVDVLDVETLDEVSEAWVSADYNLKTQYEEYNQRHRQGGSLTDPAFQLLRQEVDSLRKSQVNVSVSDTQMQAIEAILSAKVAAVEKSIVDKTYSYCEVRDQVLGETIEDAMGRIEALEKGGSQLSALEARIHSLEQWKAVSSAWINQKQSSAQAELLDRINQVVLDISDLAGKYDALKVDVGQLARREWVELRLQQLINDHDMNPAFLNDLRDLQRRVPMMEHAIHVLDSQFQHISTKQLAEHIVRLTNPGFEQRLGKLEVKTNGLESKTNEIGRAAQHDGERLNNINELILSVIQGEKRTASPISLDEPNKKRKLEVNGRHASPLQHQQQRNSPLRRPSS
jgi:chromosome segregation ATPase